MATHLAARRCHRRSAERVSSRQSERRPVVRRQREPTVKRGSEGETPAAGREMLNVLKTQTPGGEKKSCRSSGEKLVQLLLFGVTLMHLGKVGGGGGGKGGWRGWREWLPLRAGSFISLGTAEQKSLLKDRFKRTPFLLRRRKRRLSPFLILQNHKKQGRKLLLHLTQPQSQQRLIDRRQNKTKQ